MNIEKFCEKLDALKSAAQKIPEGLKPFEVSVYFDTPQLYLTGGESDKELVERFMAFAKKCNQPVLKNQIEGDDTVTLNFRMDGVWVLCSVGERYVQWTI